MGRTLKPSNRKKCPDCGKRGNWPKTIVGDSCEECSAIKKRRHALAKEAYDRCSKRAGGGMGACHPSTPPMCASCTEYFANLEKE